MAGEQFLKKERLRIVAFRRCIGCFDLLAVSSIHLIIVFIVSVLRFVRDVFRFINDDSPVVIGKSTLWIIVFDSFIFTIARITSHLIEVASDWIEDSLSIRIGASAIMTGVVERRYSVVEVGTGT